MKKILIFLMAVLSASIALLFVVEEQNADNLYMDALGRPGTYTRLQIPDLPADILLAEFQELSEQYNCSFIREDYVNVKGKSVLYRSGIFASGYWQQADFPLVSGHLPSGKEEFLATWDTDEKNQAGIIRDRFQDTPMVFQNYTGQDLSGAGTWYLCSDYEDREAILVRLSDWLDIPEEQLQEVGWLKTFSSGPIKILLAGVVLLLLVFGVLCLFYPFSSARQLSVKALLGWKQLDTWWSLMGPVLGWGGLFCLAGILIPWLMYSDLDGQLLLKLVGMEGGLWLLCLGISGVAFLVLRSFSAVSLLKNNKRIWIPYLAALLMKTVTLVVLAIVTLPLVTMIQTGIRMVQEEQAYAKAGDMLGISSFEYVGNEFSQMLNGNNVLGDKFQMFFEEVQKTADAGYFSATQYNRDYFTLPGADASGYQEPLILVEMNENELVRYQTWLSQPAKSYFQTSGITLIVPDCLDEAQKKLAEFAVRYPYEVQGKTMDVHLQTYPYTGALFFTQDAALTRAGLAFVDKPIFVTLSNEKLSTVGDSLTSSPLSNPLRIPNTPGNLEAAQKALDKAGLQANRVVLEPLKDISRRETADSVRTYLLIVAGCMGFLVFCDGISTWYLVLILLQMRRREVFVGKLMGASLFDSYQNEIISLLVIWTISLCAFVFMKPDLPEMALFAGLLVLDGMFWLQLIRRQESASIQAILKGDE